ncbi:MAG: PhnB protein; putative DNA binding 3-demethylubiquinone-9 3-methyltransferase domain protein, partial [uncultured Nocardioidaceae bacterium]
DDAAEPLPQLRHHRPRGHGVLPVGARRRPPDQHLRRVRWRAGGPRTGQRHARDARDPRRPHAHGLRHPGRARPRRRPGGRPGRRRGGRSDAQPERRGRRAAPRLLGRAERPRRGDRAAAEADVGRRVRDARRRVRHGVDGEHHEPAERRVL